MAFGNMCVYLRIYVLLIIYLNITQSNSFDKLPKSLTVNLSKDKIRIKIPGDQILVGNRKTVTYSNHDSSRTSKVVYEFLGLPFAQVPVKEKRFQFPFKLDKALPSDVYDATYTRPSCMQEYDNTFPGFKGSEMWNPANKTSEDCLYFNIWIPVTDEQDELLYFKNKNSDQVEYFSDMFKFNSPLKATLFWVYGGSYNSGSANLRITDGTIFSSFENVIVITANYRVGPFGFLYFNTSSAPGNAGVADNVMALECYRDFYMDFFGGDKDKICLFGESAGSMSLHYLLISDKNHLFSRLVLQSSSSFLETSYRDQNDAFRVSLSLAEKTGCLQKRQPSKNASNFDTPEVLKIKHHKQYNLSHIRAEINYTYSPAEIAKITECLVNLNESILSEKQFEIDYVNEYLKMQFVPTNDYFKLIRDDPMTYDFLSSDRNLNHDILVGINQNEGTYFTFYLYNEKFFNINAPGSFIQSNIQFDNKFILNQLYEAMKTKYPDDYRNVVDKIDKHFYEKFVDCLHNLYTKNNNSIFPDDFSNGILDYNLDSQVNKKKNSPELAWHKFSKIIGDINFNCPSIKLANEYSKIMPGRTYFYKFNKRSNNNPWPKWMGVIHGYEIEYIFGVPWLDYINFDGEDRFVSANTMNYWANFARTGKLYSIYERLNGTRDHYVELASASQVKLSTEVEELEEFNKLYRNCEVINKLGRYQSYSSKYETCLKHSMNNNNNNDDDYLNDATNSATLNLNNLSTFSQFLLFLIITVTSFILNSL